MARFPGLSVFEGAVKFLVLPDKWVDKFVVGDTTPSVKNIEHYQAKNTGAVTVTNFDDGAEGQHLHILGDGFTTIANNANIKTNTGANKLLAVNKVYTFYRFNSIWYEGA